MKYLLTTFTTIIAVGMFMTASTALAAKPDKTLVCHVGSELGSNDESYQDNPDCTIPVGWVGDYNCPDAGKVDLISVSQNAKHIGNPAHYFMDSDTFEWEDYSPEEGVGVNPADYEEGEVIGIDAGCEFPVETAGFSAYVLNLDGDSPVWKLTTLSSSDSAHAHANIDGFVTFSGTQNNGGSHGSAEIETESLHLILETTSVVLIGEDENQAVYGGLITEVIFNNVQPPPPPPPPPPCPAFPDCPPPPPPPPPPTCSQFDLGSYVYFSVTDNGQGNNADPDTYIPALLPSCDEFLDGGASFPWFIFVSTSLDPESNDKIKVN